MGYKQFIYNSSLHYSYVFKAGHPLAIQIFLLSVVFLDYKIQNKKVENLNPWIHKHISKLCDLEQ